MSCHTLPSTGTHVIRAWVHVSLLFRDNGDITLLRPTINPQTGNGTKVCIQVDLTDLLVLLCPEAGLLNLDTPTTKLDWYTWANTWMAVPPKCVVSSLVSSCQCVGFVSGAHWPGFPDS